MHWFTSSVGTGPRANRGASGRDPWRKSSARRASRSPRRYVARTQPPSRRAGVAVGTVYRHFPSKSDLFAEVFREASQHEVDAMSEAVHAASGTASERIAAGVEAFARRALRGRRLAWALLAEPVDPAVEAERLHFRHSYRDLMAEVIAEGIEAGDLPDQDVEVTAAALIGAIGETMLGPLSPTAKWRRSRGADRLPDQLLHSRNRRGARHDVDRRKAHRSPYPRGHQPATAAGRLQRLRVRHGDGRGRPARGRRLGRRERSPRSARSRPRRRDRARPARQREPAEAPHPRPLRQPGRRGPSSTPPGTS